MAVGTLEPRSAAPAPAGPPPDETSLLPRRLAHARPLFDPEIVRRATGESFRKLDPRTLMKNPVMFVVEVGAALTTVFLIRDIVAAACRHRVRPADLDVAVVHGPVRQLRRGDGRGARQGAGRRAPQDQDRLDRQAHRGRPHRGGLGRAAARGRRRHVRAGRHHPWRRGSHRRHRVGGRVGDHRRERAGHPRVGRRSERR